MGVLPFHRRFSFPSLTQIEANRRIYKSGPIAGESFWNSTKRKLQIWTGEKLLDVRTGPDQIDVCGGVENVGAYQPLYRGLAPRAHYLKTIVVKLSEAPTADVVVTVFLGGNAVMSMTLAAGQNKKLFTAPTPITVSAQQLIEIRSEGGSGFGLAFHLGGEA